MKYAADFRAEARSALSGKWPLAVLTGFVAALIGAGIATGGGGSSRSIKESLQELQYTDFWPILRPILLVAGIVLVVWAIALIVISGAGKLGYGIFNLNLVDGRDTAFMDLFSQFDRLWDGFCMNFLMALYTFLWSLLFVIPGIIKRYSYAMTPYIMAECPGMPANDAITQSRYLMDGNKWRLFCLGFSFIGWTLLYSAPLLIAVITIYVTGNLGALISLIPCGIVAIAGRLFLRPYQEAAYAAFYRDISNTHPEEA